MLAYIVDRWKLPLYVIFKRKRWLPKAAKFLEGSHHSSPSKRLNEPGTHQGLASSSVRAMHQRKGPLVLDTLRCDSQVSRNQSEDMLSEHWHDNDIPSSNLWGCNRQTVYGPSQALLGALDVQCTKEGDNDQEHEESWLEDNVRVDPEGLEGKSRRHHQTGFPEVQHIQHTQCHKR